MQVVALHQRFNKLQKIYGDTDLDPIYGAGDTKSPDISFVFMNPTGKNVAALKSWKGLKAPWLGTKNTWNLFHKIGLISKELLRDIKSKRPGEWDYPFSENVYKALRDKKVYVTNLSKATQKDARHLPDSVFKEYVSLLYEEIDHVKPKIIISFGNQVSSILLNQKIEVSKCRRQVFPIVIKGKEYLVYPVYYPVGQGMRNISKAIADLKWIMKRNLH